MGRALVSSSGFVTRMGAQFYTQDDGSVAAQVVIDERHEGPPGYAHGGALAAMLDEAMGAAVWFSGTRVAAVHLGFDYRRAVPLGVEVHVSGWVEHREGRKVFTSGVIRLPDGIERRRSERHFRRRPADIPGRRSRFYLLSHSR